jgi:hypothetical protein
VTNGIFLGQAIVPGLQAGYDQQIIQSIQLPSRIPQGLSLNSVGKARIAVVIDPENVIDESVKTNNDVQTAPMVLRIIQANGKAQAVSAANGAKSQTTPAVRAGRTRKLYHRPMNKKTDNSVLHKLSVFPSDVGNFLKKYL